MPSLHPPSAPQLLSFLLLLGLTGSMQADGATYLVKADGTGDFPTIQQALDAATPGDVIQLSDGIYSQPGNVDLDFLGKDLTLVSQGGDPEQCIIDGQGVSRGIQFHLGETSACTVDGIGFERAYTSAYGAAILCTEGSSPTIRNCLFRDCSSWTGGAISILNSSPILESCLLEQNAATTYGGAVFAWGASAPVLRDCTIRYNEGQYGGGVAIRLNTTTLVEGCLIYGNVGTVGGGISLSNSNTAVPVILECTIVDNFAAEGAALASEDAAHLSLGHCIFAYNRGGWTIHADVPADITLSCCDVYGNQSGDYVGTIAGQLGLAGNISADPLFCDLPGLNFTLDAGSPCLPENHPTCDLIGALPAGCGPALEVVHPNGGESFCQSEPVTITWVGGDRTRGLVRVELFRGDLLSGILADSIANDGEFEWIADPPEGHRYDYRVKVIDLTTDEEDASDGPFAILFPVPMVSAPADGSVYMAEHDSVRVLWEKRCLGSQVRLELLRNGEPCGLIASEAANTGTFAWLAAQCDEESEGYQVRVTDLASGLWGDSEGQFGITPPWPFGLVSITDVGNDQGGQVRLRWIRHLHDATGEPIITGYSIYRRQDEYLLPPGNPAEEAAEPALRRLDGWDFVGTAPARGDSIYQMISPTLCDSTAEAGICWSVFFVSALTPDPLVYFDSAPDSGYSVDNLAPAAPAGLHWIPPSSLAWEISPEPDLDCYTIYGSTDDTWDGDDPILGQTRETIFEMEGVFHSHFMVTARDSAGNEGAPSLLQAPAAVPQGSIRPTAVRLHAPRPNPFADRTWIGFDLPHPVPVEVTIHGPDGRRVALVITGTLAAGRHAVSWSGRGEDGRRLPSGIYWARMRAGDTVRSQRLVLLM